MTDVQSPAPRDPEQQERAEAFNGALQGVSNKALGVALASGAFALTARPAFGQSMPSVTDVLNFALTLEFLEREFYAMGVDSGVIPGSGNAQGKYEEILANEEAHVALLQNALGDDAVEQPSFDFTAGGMFDPFNNYGEFLLLSQGFEDTGVRAYKGGAPALVGSDVLTTALQIHSVEARHASVVRRLVNDFGDLGVTQDGWIQGANTPIDALSAVYAGEDDQTVAGIDISGTTDPDGDAYSDELITESYDEPLTMSEVNAIAGLFIESGSSADVTVSIDNVGASAWTVDSVDGADGVAPTGEENPTFSLTTGTRYRIDNNGGSTHPFALQDGSENYLLTQNFADVGGSFEGDGAVNFVSDEEGITFTLTEDLAAEVSRYRCTTHAPMNGDVSVG